MAEAPLEEQRSVRGGSLPLTERGSEPDPEVPWLISRSRYLYLALFNSPLIAALAIFFRSLSLNLTGPYRAPSPWQALGEALSHPAVWVLLIIEAVTGLFWLAIAAELQRVRESRLVAILTRRLFDEEYEARLVEEWAGYREGRSAYGPLIEQELRMNQKEYRPPRALFADLILRPALIKPLSAITAEGLRQDRRLFANFLDHHLADFNAALGRREAEEEA